MTLDEIFGHVAGFGGNAGEFDAAVSADVGLAVVGAEPGCAA